MSIPGIIFLFPKRKKNIHIVGLGGAGCNIVEYIFQKGLDAKYTYVSTSDRTRFLNGINKVEFHRSRNYRRRRDWIKDKDILTDEIKSIFNKDDHYIIIAGLRGYTGSLLMRDLYYYLSKHNKTFTAIASYPFNFEGEKSLKNAKTIVADISGNSKFKSINLEIIREKYGNLGGREAFKKADDLFYRQILNKIY